MPGRSLFIRIIIVLAVSMLLVLPFPAQIASAGTIWLEGPIEFVNGTTDNVSLRSGMLSLNVDESMLDHWTMRSPGMPAHRYNPAMAYDSAHSDMVLFGGWDGEHFLNDTWTYNLSMNKWMNMNPQITPSVRDGHAMVYDKKCGVMVLFGGRDGNQLFNDTWTYDLTTNNWTHQNPPIAPSARMNHAMAYDSLHGGIVLFGGSGGYGILGDTWMYNLSTNNWTNLNPSTAPSARWGHGIAYDGVHDEMILFGGNGYNENGLSSVLNDTWTYNLSANNWTNRNPQTAPSARYAYGMAYDSAHAEEVLFGGSGLGPNGVLNDTWTYNLSTNYWGNMNPSTASSVRYFHTMAYDCRYGEVVLFGGWNQYVGLGDTWTYNLSTNNWMSMNPPSTPSPRYGHAMVYDIKYGVMVLFGGWDGNQLFNDTWTYNLTTNNWTDMNPATAPPARAYHAMVYDSTHHNVVLFGGSELVSHYILNVLNDTWTYNLSTNNWTNMNPQTAPPARAYHTMAYDSAYGEIVLFGGWSMGPPSDDLYDDTWAYNLSTNNWTNMNPITAPPARNGSAMVYDKANDLIVLFGGRGVLNFFLCDTWTYNLSTNNWMNVNPLTAPSARELHAMAFDSAHDEVVLFGGDGYNSLLNDTWTYNLNTNIWTNMNSSTVPPTRDYHAMVYDITQGDMVLFGGFGRGSLDDTWTYNPTIYHLRGYYSSIPHDTGGTSYFGTISWDADVPQNTSLRFQFRSANSKENVTMNNFLGPDGTVNSFYDITGQQINSVNNGTRWFQYRGYFSTNDATITPVLRRVNVNYNLLQTVNLFSPVGGENWTGLQNITWSASDPDNDSLTFDILLMNETSSIILAHDLPSNINNWTFNASAFTQGKYRIKVIAKDNNPTIPLTAIAISEDFTISHPPHVGLLSPLNNSIVNTSTVHLAWLGTDPENDTLNYTIFYASHPFSNGIIFQNTTTLEYLDLANLTDNTTYYWTVDATDGINNHTDIPTEVWSFTVKLPTVIPPINHPPQITSTPLTSATEGVEYVYNVMAQDPDNDTLTFSLNSPPAGMTIDPSSGKLSWTPSATGTFTVTVMVSDGRGGSDIQTFSVVVSLGSKSVCSITSPMNGSTVSETINITGSAMKGTSPLERVEVRIDGGDWMQATGLESWKLVLYTRTLTNGQHTIEARAYGGQLYSDNASVTITVNNALAHLVPPPDHPITFDQFLWSLLLMIIIAIGVVVVLLFRSRRGFTG